MRSGNCIGGGDFTKDRIVKDCAQAFLTNKKLTIRSPNASRPWQHVMEPIYGYLKLAQKLYLDKKFVGSWNFGPNVKNNIKVIEVVKFGKKYLNSKSKIKLIKKKLYESEHLALNSTKSLKYLNWKTYLNSKKALELSFDWYKCFNNIKEKNKIVKISLSQIRNYQKKYIK